MKGLEEKILEGTRYTTKEAILRRAKELIGTPLREIDKTGRLRTGKGAIGTTIEENWYGYTPNSESEPDFPEAGVELKATPYLRGKNGIRAKERLVCNIINYMEEYSKTFYTSAFWHKCSTMLLMSYEHRDGVPKGDFTIDEAVLFTFPEEDLAIIEKDWETIMEKVRSGQAHLISEGDTYYLSACTKGANSGTTRAQPFSDTPAKQRAYSLKAGYMSRILEKYIFGDTQSEHIIKDWHILQKNSFDQYVVEKISPYIGMTQDELCARFDVKSKPKNLNEVLLAHILEVKGKIAYTDEFRKASIVPKTIRVQRNGTIKEHMSFPVFDFIQLNNESDWESSTLYHYLAPTKFLFIIFQEDDKGKFVFDRIQFWNIPLADLEEVHRVWIQTKKVIQRGVKLIPTNRGISNDLPKPADNPVAHVRPHGRNGQDRLPLPDGRMMAKQCFWLNNTYIQQQIFREGREG